VPQSAAMHARTSSNPRSADSHNPQLSRLSGESKSLPPTYQKGGVTEEKIGAVIPIRQDVTATVGQEVEVPCSMVVPLKEQPRTYFDRKKMDGLVESIKVSGQKQLINAIRLPDGRFQISDGERRWRACTQLGIKVKLRIVEALSSHEEEIERSAVSNFLDQEHPPFERAKIFHRLRRGPLQRSVRHISQEFGVAEPTVTAYISVIEKVNPKVLELMDPAVQGSEERVLAFSIGLKLVPGSMFQEEQLTLAQEIMQRHLGMSGASRLINRRFIELGVSGHKRDRRGRPREHLQTIRRLLEQFELFLLNLRHEDPNRWRQLFTKCSLEEQKELLKYLKLTHEEIVTLARELRAHIEATEKQGV
jgi:ParB/RepB/Spo0J family partition protein